MVKRIKDFIRYTATELENYTNSKNSCIKKINKRLHLNFPPYGLTSFKATLLKLISEKKIGSYDMDLDGIILDIRNIKVLGNVGAIRFDDPCIHLNIQADCYVFQPKVGSVVHGLVKHKSQRQIGVIIYRVFSVPIRLSDFVDKSSIAINSEIEFRIKNFDLQNAMPYIEGELMAKEVVLKKNNSIKFEDYEDEMEDMDKNNLFKKPTPHSKSACEILADSENEEIVFSELSYLNEEEAQKLKQPKKQKKVSCESSIYDVTLKPDMTSKPSLKTTVTFEDSSDSSSETLETNQNVNSFSNIKSSKQKEEQKSNHYDVDQSKAIFSYHEGSSSDNELQNKIQNLKKSNVKRKLNNDNLLSCPSLSFEGDDDENKIENEIKGEISVNGQNVHKKLRVSACDGLDINLKISNELSANKISYKDTQIKSEDELDKNIEVIQSSFREDSEKNYSIKTEPLTIKNSQESNSQIKTEVVTPVKVNGYESEDLFEEHLENTIPSNQYNNNTGKKRKREESFTIDVSAIIENNIKQRKSKELSAVHSTQKEIPGRSDESSIKSTSDSSFNEAFKEILQKTKNKRLSESENSELNLELPSKSSLLNIKRNKSSKKKSNNNELDISISEILSSSMESKLKGMKSQLELNNLEINEENNMKNKEQTNLKKSRKRKISFNDSINDLLSQMIKEKSSQIQTSSVACKKLKK